MRKEDQNENWRCRIESQLFQIKVLLIILIDLCILGFYGLSRAMWDDIAGIMTKIFQVLLVAGFLGTLGIIFVWKADQTTQIKTDQKVNKELQNNIDKAKSGEKQPS